MTSKNLHFFPNLPLGQTKGLFRAGAIPIYLNTSAIVGAALLGKMSKLAKLTDNYFEMEEIQLVEGPQFEKTANFFKVIF